MTDHESLCRSPARARSTQLDGTSPPRHPLSLPELMMVEFTFEKNGVGALHTPPAYPVRAMSPRGVFEDGRRLNRRPVHRRCFIVPSNTIHGAVALERGRLIDLFNTPHRRFPRRLITFARRFLTFARRRISAGARPNRRAGADTVQAWIRRAHAGDHVVRHAGRRPRAR